MARLLPELYNTVFKKRDPGSEDLRKKSFMNILGGRTAPRSSQISTKREMPDGFRESEEALTRQFAGMKRQAGARFGEAGRQLEQGLERVAARSGRTGGEAFRKALETGTTAMGREQASLEAGIDAQEAQMRGALQEQKRGFEERAIDRQRQAEQVKATLAFQEDSFANNLALEWAGMDINERVTMFNAATAAKQAGLTSANAWDQILTSQFIGVLNPRKRDEVLGLRSSPIISVRG